MFTKSAIALIVLLFVGTGSTAFAYEDPENKIGDRYPFLEQTYPMAKGNAGALHMPMQQAPKFNQYTNEDPENKIGDRYPLLEQSIRFASVTSKASARTTRSVKPFTFAEKREFDLQSTRAVF